MCSASSFLNITAPPPHLETFLGREWDERVTCCLMDKPHLWIFSGLLKIGSPGKPLRTRLDRMELREKESLPAYHHELGN